MKTLFVQLARLGDIYMTWPTLRAYHRKNPNAELHILVREKFKSALVGIDIPLNIHIMPSLEVVEATQFGGFEFGLASLKKFTQSLASENFDSIVNLSFSPFSSYLVKHLDSGKSQICGYTRTEDGYLQLPDEWSAYFYSQVGLNRDNRLHVTDIFAEVSGVTLTPADFSTPNVEELEESAQIVIHVGGSEQKKRISADIYRKVIKVLVQGSPQQLRKIWLVGAGQEERFFAENLASEFASESVENKVDCFSLPQLVSLIDKASLLIAPDSVTLHISSLTQTPVLNLSSNVNFWETGPKSPISAVLEVKNSEIDEKELSNVLSSLLRGEVVQVQQPEESVGWSLIEFIYFGGTPPRLKSFLKDPLLQFRETNELMVSTLKNLRDKGRDEIQIQVLERGDDILRLISNHFSDLQVLYRWYACEKLRIGPGSFKDVCIQTLSVHEKLSKTLETLAPQKHEIRSLVSRISSGCQALIQSKNIREQSLQELVERLFEFSQMSIQIVSERNQALCLELSTLLETFLTLLTKKDFDEIKLLLEYDMISHFQAWEESLSDEPGSQQGPERTESITAD